MSPESDRQITLMEPWFQRASAEESSYIHAGKSFGEILRDCYSSSNAYSVFIAADPTAATCTTREAPASTAWAPALLIVDSIGRRAGYTEFCAESVTVVDPGRRIVAGPSPSIGGGWECLMTRAAFHQVVMSHHDFLITGSRP